VLGEPTYTWTTNYSACTAEIQCQNGTVHKTETVTPDVKTTVADCQNAGAITYTADFSEGWEDQTVEIVGEKNMDKHVSDEVVYKNNTGDTHDEYHMCCDTLIQDKVPHTYDATTHACVCEKVEEFTLTLNVNGTLYAEITAPYNSDITDQLNAVKAKFNAEYAGKYILNSWYDKDWNIWNYTTMPASDMTLKAGYDGVLYTLYYYSDGVKKAEESVPYSNGPVTNYEPENMTKTGYTFKGWKYYLNYNAETGAFSNEYTTLSGMPAQDMYANAQWQVNTYTITWELDGGTAGGTYPTSANYGTSAGVSKSDSPTKTGYTFTGWVDQDGNTVELNSSNYYAFTMPAKNVTLTAQWECAHANTKAVDNKDGQTHNMVCENGHVVAEKVPHDFNNDDHECVCGKVEAFYIYIDPNGGTIDKSSSNKLYFSYGTTLGDLNKDYITKEGHTFKEWKFYTDAAHTEPYTGTTVPGHDIYAVAQWEANLYTLTIHALDFEDGNYLASFPENVEVPYGALLKDYIPDNAGEDYAYKPIYKVGDKIKVDGEMFTGTWTITNWISDGDIVNIETAKMPLNGITIQQDYSFTGWEYDWYDHNGDKLEAPEGVVYREDGVRLTGWQQINHADYLENGTGSAWYYFDQETYHRAEGLTRVPYPIDAYNNAIVIDGKTYAPDQESIDYAESKGETFIDATEGWFLFGEDGKFQSTITGKYTDTYVDPETDIDIDTTRWIENGHIAWHPGMVKIVDEYGSNYYYFLGDVNKGGNILATEAEGATKNKAGSYDIHVSRANHKSLDREFNSGIYVFAYDGSLNHSIGHCFYVKPGLRYFGVDGADKYRLMCGLGLAYDDGTREYFYVCHDGEQVVNASYWVPANDYGIPEGMYDFDEKGWMIIPEITEKNGIYSEDGAWVYYENGKIGYNKGLIHFEGTWYGADGKIAKTEDAWIYVRSNGALATGKYYVTTVAEGAPLAAGDKGTFDEYGILQDMKNGIVDGKYYINDKIQYNAGVVKLESGKYIYVRSNGEVVMGKDYWITNVGDSGVVAKKYTFDADGYFTPEFTAALDKNIVDGYYYENGHIAYGAGVVEYGGGYIYVRSNGQVATGEYWATNTNGILDAKLYDWGTDGIYIPE